MFRILTTASYPYSFITDAPYFSKIHLTLSYSLQQSPNKHSLSGYVAKILYTKKILIDLPVSNAS